MVLVDVWCFVMSCDREHGSSREDPIEASVITDSKSACRSVHNSLYFVPYRLLRGSEALDRGTFRRWFARHFRRLPGEGRIGFQRVPVRRLVERE